MQTALLALFGLSACVVAADVLGVPSSKQHLYQGDTFSCDGGSRTYPIGRVNDDYCDCKDGTDEPGTSACANGKFYCINKGFRGKTVPASIVNDGVCDCCDGSDEYDSPVKCANTCDSDGAEWRKLQAERIRQAEEGALKKKQYIEQGQKETSERDAKIAELKNKKEEAAARRDEADRARKLAEEEEEKEKEERKHNKDKAVIKGLGLQDATADELRAVLIRLARDTKQGDMLAQIAKDWHTEKSTAAAAASGEPGSTPPPAAVPVAQIAWKDEDTGAGGYKSEEAERRRDEHRRAQEDLRAAERELGDAEGAAKHDYGPQSEFAPLRGRCIEKKVQKYTYKVCPFDRSSQDGTSLGTFAGWGEGGHSVMKFTNGQHCYQGPNRSMTVTLECGVDEELLSVDEPSKCAYTATLRTPAACDDKYANELRLQLESGGAAAHDEL